MQDLRLSLRSLRSTPVVTVVAILSLALGIGANTAIFSLVNSLLLRPLPVEKPDRLVTVSSAYAVGYGYKTGVGWNYAMWERLRDRAQIVDGAFAWWLQPFDLSPGGEVQRVDGIVASGAFFSTLRVRALLGRTFTVADDVRGGGSDGPVAVISYRLWQRRFGGTAGVIGTRLLVERVPFTIVGVTPPEFVGIEVGQAFDVAIPLGTDPLIHGARTALDQTRALPLAVMLRLKPDQSIETATAGLRAMQPQIVGEARGTPQFVKEPYVLVPAATGTADRLRQQFERPLVTLSIVAGIVLVVACANIANLLLARAAARRHELSVRLALGASRWRLARPLLLESLMLAGVGGLLGLIVAAWGSATLVSQLTTSRDPVAAGAPIFLDLPLDWRVMAFTAGAAFTTVLLFGTAPAFRAARAEPIDALKAQGRAAGRARGGVSGALVVVQVALSLVLVVVAGLFAGTFRRLAALPLGFEADRVLVVTVDLARSRVDPAKRALLADRIVESIAAVPGVASASGSTSIPGGGASNLLVDARGRSVDAGGRVMWNLITPHWFATYGISMRAGRDFTDRDSANAPPVVVVNERLAARLFPGQSVIGRTLDGTVNDSLEGRTVVGVVADAAYGSLRDAVPPAFYLPLAQAGRLMPPGTTIQIGVRSDNGSPARQAPAVAAALAAVDRDLAFSFRPLVDRVNASIGQERLLAMLSGFFGLLALLLAGLGLYGVAAYGVVRQRAEIGIRIALGALPRGVVRLVLWRELRLVFAGVIAGVAVSLWLSRFVAALLFGLQPRDPLTLSVAVVTLVVVGMLAGWLPASHASRIDPAEVLRETGR